MADAVLQPQVFIQPSPEDIKCIAQRGVCTLQLSIGYHAHFYKRSSITKLWGLAAGRGTFESILQCHHFSSGSGAAECSHSTSGAE